MEDEPRDDRRDEFRRFVVVLARTATVVVVVSLLERWASDPDFVPLLRRRLRAFFPAAPRRPAPKVPEVVLAAERVVTDALREGRLSA